MRGVEGRASVVFSGYFHPAHRVLYITGVTHI
jgi:hypothetical protein